MYFQRPVIVRIIIHCDHNELYFALSRATTGSYMLMKIVHQNSNEIHACMYSTMD